MECKRKRVESVLVETLNYLWASHKEIINRSVKEECINHQMCKQLELNLLGCFKELKSINVDMEYNKNYANPKSYIEESKKVNFRPDIIVHRRNSNLKNILALELKKDYPNKKDFKTLTKLLENPYNYKFCYAISYLPAQNYFKIYKVESQNEIFVSKLCKIEGNKDMKLKWEKKNKNG